MISFKMIADEKKKNKEDTARFAEVTIPLCCDANVPITAKLLQKHKEIKEYDEELTKKREEFDIRMRKAEKRRKELKKKEQLLIHSMKEFDPFIQESETKKVNAESKYELESRVISEIDEQIAKLTHQHDALQLKKEALQKQLEKYLPAKLFLEKVAKNSVQFDDVSEIITFYDTLVAVNQELTENEDQDLKSIDEEREKLAKFKTENENKILALTNQLYELQQEKEKKYNQALCAEARYNDIKSSNSKTTMALGQLTMAISSMYMTICTFEQVYPTEQNTSLQIEKVYEFIQDWSEVVPAVKKFLEKSTHN